MTHSLELEEMYRVLNQDGHLFANVLNEGGICWVLGRRRTTAKHVYSATLNYQRAIQVDHINCVWQVEKAIRRYFRIIRRIFFPLPVPSFHVNLVTTYRARKRT